MCCTQVLNTFRAIFKIADLNVRAVVAASVWHTYLDADTLSVVCALVAGIVCCLFMILATCAESISFGQAA